MNKWAEIYRRKTKKRKPKVKRPKVVKPKVPKPLRKRPNPEELPFPAILHSYSELRPDGSTAFHVQDSVPASEYGAWQFRRAFEGAVTSDFKSVRRRELPIHNYHVNAIRCTGSDMVVRTTFSSGWRYLEYFSSTLRYSTVKPLDLSDHIPLQEAEWNAVRKLAGKINKQSINLAVAMAERRQTVQLITGTARRLYAAARALRRADIGAVYAAFGISTRVPSAREHRRLETTHPDKRLADHWLEYNFGWKPLLNDVYGAAEALANHVYRDTYHGSVSSTGRASKSVFWSPSGNRKYDRFSQASSVRVKHAIRYKLDNYAVAALASTGMSNPLSVAWEVLPFSFVVDWFIPVSQYVQTLQAFDGFTVQAGTKSTIIDTTLHKDFAVYNDDGNGNTFFRTGTSFVKQFDYRRVQVSSWPPAVPPAFRNPLDKDEVWTCLTSIALLTQIFRKP